MSSPWNSIGFHLLKKDLITPFKTAWKQRCNYNRTLLRKWEPLHSTIYFYKKRHFNVYIETSAQLKNSESVSGKNYGHKNKVGINSKIFKKEMKYICTQTFAIN